MKKLVIILALVLLLSIPICIAVFGSGFLGFFNPGLSADHVAFIQVTDGMASGGIFEITDPETIHQLTELVNDLGPAVGRYGTWNGWHYSVTFLDASGNEIFHVSAVSEYQISSGDYFYPADAADLIAYLSELDA